MATRLFFARWGNVWTIRRGLLLLVFCAGGSFAFGQAQRHLFLDPGFLRTTENAELRVNPAQVREVVIRADQAWEKLMISFFLTVREEEGKLRMWYICRDAENQPNLAYAESADGIAWVKPKLGVVEYQGSTDNNLVGVSGVEGVVFQDPKARTAAEKYVYVTRLKRDGIYRYFSPDGLRWQRDAKALLPIPSDTQNVTFWDENLGCYVMYLRGRGRKPGDPSLWRTVTRTTARDLTKPMALPLPNEKEARAALVREGGGLPTVLEADAADPAESDVYNISAQPYPLDRRWYVGFPSFFQREVNPANPSATNYGRVEVQFVGSRDGVRWERYDRRVYAAPGLVDSETRNVVFMGTGMVVRGDEIWQYGTGFRSHHGDVAARKERADGVIQRYVQRVDGFVSLDFANGGGGAVTAPVKVDGAALRVNMDSGALGALRVGLLDREGKALAGFGEDECDVLRTNSTGAVVSWKGSDDLSALQGREVQVVFLGARVKLYSFRFDGE
jgi:hypothetical protein